MTEHNDSGETNIDADNGQVAEQLHQMHEDSRSAKASADQANAKLAEIAKVFGNQGEREEDPEAWSNDILHELMEAEKAGQKLPISSKMFKQMYNMSLVQNENQKIIQDLRNRVANLQNPVTQVDRGAYARVDEGITQAIEELYGEENSIVADAVRAQMVETIKLIQNESPDAWDRIRRDPGKLTKLINYTVAETVPPAVMQRLAQEAEDNEPITAETISDAFYEFEHSPQIRALSATEREIVQREIRLAEYDLREKARRRR